MIKQLSLDGANQLEAHLKFMLKRLEDSRVGLRDVLAQEDILYIIENDLKKDISSLLSLFADLLGKDQLEVLVSNHLADAAQHLANEEGKQPYNEDGDGI